MHYFFLFLILFVSSCKKDVVLSRPSFSKDPIQKEYSKKIDEFQKEYDEIKKSIEDAKKRIGEADFSPKMAELIKSEIFAQEKFLFLIQQEIDYLKIQVNERSKYYLEKSDVLTDEIIEKEHQDFILQQNATPRKYSWRLRPGLVLPEDTKKESEKPKTESGHH